MTKVLDTSRMCPSCHRRRGINQFKVREAGEWIILDKCKTCHTTKRKLT